MTEELTTTLAQIESLHVISRTSVMEYKDAKISLPEIAKELNVDAVVEGSIMKVGNRVRITAQLIQAKTDRHLWAKSYERDLSDILTLQNEVASAIASEINAKLSPQEQEKLTKAPRVNPDAYQAYLSGLDLRDRPDFSQENTQQAIEMFERAVELDPSFAECYADLAEAHTIMFWAGIDRTEERLKKAKEAIDRAFAIQPDSPEAHLVLGWYYYRGYKDYERALSEFAIAERNLPNDSGILEAKGAVLRRQGKFQAAVDDLKKASDLNPRAFHLQNNIATTYTFMRSYSEADRFYNRSIALAPDQLLAYQFKANNYLVWSGNTRMARSTLEKMPKKEDPASVQLWFKVEYYERNYQRALERLSPAFDNYLDAHAFRTRSAGLTYRLMNQPDLARTSFDASRDLLEQAIKEDPNNPNVHSWLGIAYAGLNQKDAAIREGKLGVDLGGISKDAFSGPDRVQDLATIYVMVGEYEAALDLTEYLLSIPSFLSAPLLRIDPIWAPLRSHPRFQKILLTH
jgi:tetratricopeptide (TPR) repeat protein